MRNKAGRSPFTTFFQHIIGSPSHSQQTRRNTRHPNGKEEIKLPLFADDILYRENLKDFTKKLLELTNEFSKVARYKINIQKSLAFIYADNELTRREINKTIPFTTTTKRIKYPGIT